MSSGSKLIQIARGSASRRSGSLLGLSRPVRRLASAARFSPQTSRPSLNHHATLLRGFATEASGTKDDEDKTLDSKNGKEDIAEAETIAKKDDEDKTLDSKIAEEDIPEAETIEPEPINKESLNFQAETKQLLDIVINSLYTDKEVFLRELISNASDALEKFRHVQMATGESVVDPDTPLEIRVETDEDKNIIRISDSGIGLTRDEMVKNLGTIAKSGTKAFLNELKQQEIVNEQAGGGMIGKFGVGFYSAFMVGDVVHVKSRSALEESADKTHVWKSEGAGNYEVAELPTDTKEARGTTVTIHLKDDGISFSDEKHVEEVLKKYSNFVNFPIFLNGSRVNSVQAIWALPPKSITDEQHSEFYKYIAGAYDEPLDRIHYRADAPLEIKALFYIPSFHTEKHGMGRMDPGVSLYSRKVLIESKSPDILPEWMRFVKGVVDSEDLPLSISREKPQDTALVAKLRKALTRKFIAHIANMARKTPEQYRQEFYHEYQFFLKEGICQDIDFKEPLSKLLLFETNKLKSHETTSFDEYMSRLPPEQKQIYFLCAPNRELALQSPYLEAFEKSGREVIFVYTAIDDFVMANLGEYGGLELLSIDKANIDFGQSKDDDKKKEKESNKSDETKDKGLSDDDAKDFCKWFQGLMPDKVSVVRVTDRLSSSPAVVTDTESGAMRRMMRFVETDVGNQSTPLKKQLLEVNPKHPIIVGMNKVREKEPMLAKILAEQVFDNCLVAAGLLDDGRSMLPRLNDLMISLVRSASEEFPETPGPHQAKPLSPVMETDKATQDLVEKMETGSYEDITGQKVEEEVPKPQEELDLNWLDDNNDQDKTSSEKESSSSTQINSESEVEAEEKEKMKAEKSK